jgi:hypothetical protein
MPCYLTTEHFRRISANPFIYNTDIIENAGLNKIFRRGVYSSAIAPILFIKEAYDVSYNFHCTNRITFAYAIAWILGNCYCVGYAASLYTTRKFLQRTRSLKITPMRLQLSEFAHQNSSKWSWTNKFLPQDSSFCFFQPRLLCHLSVVLWTTRYTI